MYAYAFYIGGYLKYNEIEENGRVYDGGMILTCMLAVIFGFFNLGQVGDHSKALVQG
jgi:hypothetical protein